MNFPKSDLGRFPVNARPLRSDPWGLCLVKTIRRLMMKRYNVDTLTIEQFRDLIASGDDSRANQIRITKDREIFLSPIVGAVSLQNIIGRFETFDKDNHYVGKEAAADTARINRMFNAIQEWKETKRTYIDIF